VDQNVCLLSALLDEVISGLEGMSGILGLTVVEIENEMLKMFRIVKVKVNP